MTEEWDETTRLTQCQTIHMSLYGERSIYHKVLWG